MTHLLEMRQMKLDEMNKIINSFDANFINLDDLKIVLSENVTNYEEKNLRYYLFDLYRRNLLYKYNSKIYKKCVGKREFKFERKIAVDVADSIYNIRPQITISIWDLNEITKFMSLQLFSNIHFIETYYYAKDVVLDCLLGFNYNVIFEKDYFSMSKYIKDKDVYIIRTINEDSPIDKGRDCSYVSKDVKENSLITVPKIEQIIVDLIVDDFFNTLIGSERDLIIRELLGKYKVNMTTCLRYVTKKHKLDIFNDYLNAIEFNIEKGEFE